MAELYRQYDKVVLDLGDDDKRDVLFSVAIADWAADNLEDFAKSAVMAPSWPTVNEPPVSIEVQAIENRGVPQVRLILGRWLKKMYLSPPAAVSVARMLRQAARKAEKHVRWLEERDPAVLLS